VDDVPATPVAALLTVQTDTSLLQAIIEGYKTDPFCEKINNAQKSIDGIEWQNKLLYIGDRLVIPHIGSLREDLFLLAHNMLGHFGFEKSYALL